MVAVTGELVQGLVWAAVMEWEVRVGEGNYEDRIVS
jgi:hypothetical protein